MEDFTVFTTGYVPPLHDDYEPTDVHGDQSWLPLNRWDDRLWHAANKPHPLDRHH